MMLVRIIPVLRAPGEMYKAEKAHSAGYPHLPAGFLIRHQMSFSACVFMPKPRNIGCFELVKVGLSPASCVWRNLVLGASERR